MHSGVVRQDDIDDALPRLNEGGRDLGIIKAIKLRCIFLQPRRPFDCADIVLKYVSGWTPLNAEQNLPCRSTLSDLWPPQ